MKSKILNFIFFLLFIIISSSFYGDEYINFHKNKKEIIINKENLEIESKKFSFDKIRQLEETNIYYSPDENILNTIIDKINNAKNKIYLEIYMLTETRILDAIKNASKKNIDIKIIIEKNPYKANNINNKAYNFLVKNNIDVIWSNPNNYSLNHSKLLIIDDEAVISTWNFTYSSFKKNREFFIFTKDKQILNDLNNIFLNDYNYTKKINYNDNLIISPDYSREKIEYLITNANKNIDLYFPYINDEKIENLLINRAKNWVKINFITDKNIEENTSFNNLKNSWINFKKLNKNKLHAKSILIDDKYLYIWSINFSDYSLDKNREIGILLNNEDIIQKFKKIFNTDFN